MPLSLFFANALGPLARLQTKDGHPHPPCRCAAGEASCSSAFSSSMFSSSSCKQQQRRRQNNQRINVVARASSSTPSNPPQRSFDGDEDELDHESAAELAKYVDPERVKQEQKRLELAWAVREKRKDPSAPCDCCGGSGTCDCQFCRGTGALTVGSELFCSVEGGCRSCPACSGRGSVPCESCKGTGQRAAWLGPGCPVDD